MTAADRIRADLEAVGFVVDAFGFISLTAFAHHARVAPKTVRNTLHVPGKWPPSRVVDRHRRFHLDEIVRWRLRQFQDAA